MPINSTFGQVVRATQDEAGHFTTGPLNRNVMAQIQQTVRRTYRRLHADFNWPHLYVRRDVPILARERYIQFPPDMDPDRTIDAWVTGPDMDRWEPLEYGIGMAEYNRLNSDKFDYDSLSDDYGTTGSPTRWSRSPIGTLNVEIWPIPVKKGSVVRFWGITRPKVLANDNDLVDIDEDLIALYAAAEWLADQKADSAGTKLEQASAHYRRLKANSQNPEAVFSLNPPRREWKGIQIRAPR